MRPAAALLALVLFAACAREEEIARAPERDPASEQALNDQIMVDPDLANQNEGNAALTVSSDHSLPLEIATPETVAAARAEATALLGGSDKLLAPPPPRPLPARTAPDFLTPVAHAAQLAGAPDCAATLDPSAAWAARLPPAFRVYPRGATLHGAGSDRGECGLRAVVFVSPVPLAEVLAFYHARARQAGLGVEHAASEDEHRLSGANGTIAFTLSLRRRDDGLTEATLVTLGGQGLTGP